MNTGAAVLERLGAVQGMIAPELHACLSRDAAETEPGLDPPPELIEESLFRAARFGVHGELPDARGRLRPVSEIVQETLARVEIWARELGCVQELALLPDLLRRGGGAGVQRAIYNLAGLDGLTKQLTDLTSAAARPDAVHGALVSPGVRSIIRG